MGFEVNFFYHEKVDGKYKTDERKEFRKKIGGPTEDTPLEKLAGAVMNQLARRDIWVVDVEVFEYTKKQITFKESNDGNGIVIKGRKFSMGGIPVEDVGAEAAAQPAPMPLPPGVHPHELLPQGRHPHEFLPQNRHPHESMQDQSNLPAVQPSSPNVNLAPLPDRPKMWMKFDPEIPLLIEAKKKRLQFSQGKKYPVYRVESMGTLGTVYTMKDDAGREVRVSDKYFITATEVKLVGDDEVEGGFSANHHRDNGPKLSYENEFDRDIPDLRHRGNSNAGRPYPRVPHPNQMLEGARAGYVGELESEMPELRRGRKII